MGQKVTLRDPNDPDYDDKGAWHQPRNLGRTLKIRKAVYGAQGWNWKDKEPVTVDVTDILNSMIVDGRLAIPSDYNKLFGDPKKGVKKQLVIWFSYKRTAEYTFVDEGTAIWDLVDYVRERQESEHRAEIDYQREGISY